MMRYLPSLAVVLGFCSTLHAQYSKAIEDNSFFIEEAYNQETRVVQHISNLVYMPQPPRSLQYTFTQEWPVFGETNQLSFDLRYMFLNGESSAGFGDVSINYRYQLFDSDDWAAVAPRFTVFLPTGNHAEGLGAGVVGFECSVAASRRVSEDFAIHVDARYSWYPGVSGQGELQLETHRTLKTKTVGGSIIWLATEHINVLMESLMISAEEFAAQGGVARETSVLVAPGIRYAIDVGSLQIVPGLAFPMFFSAGSGESGGFFYLSFEHPF